MTGAGTMAITLALAGIGGTGFALLRLPLAWMLGAMAAATVAALCRVRVAIPGGLRAAMMAVLGVMLGASFTPDILARARLWPWSLGALIPYVLLTTLAGWLYLHRRRGVDRVTAWFTAAPGGLNEMVTVGTALGGDSRAIALAHALRILLVVALVPVILGLWSGQPPPAMAVPISALTFASVPPLAALPDAGEMLWLLACGATLFPAQHLRLPAGALMAPLLASAVVHIAGLATGQPPGLLVVAAQVVVGAAIGCRFTGSDVRLLARTLPAAALLALGMLGIGFVLAVALSPHTAVPVPVLVLAFAPGGVTEMCLVALGLGLDVTFVSTHHLVRVLVIILAIPAAGRWLARIKPAPGPFPRQSSCAQAETALFTNRSPRPRETRR